MQKRLVRRTSQEPGPRSGWRGPARGAVRLVPPVIRRHPSAVTASRELGIAFLAVLAYFAVRGLTESAFPQAAENARTLIRFENWLGIRVEHDVQDFFLRDALLTNIANWVYIWGHWPVITVVAVWLALEHPARYRRLRNAFLISGGIGLVIFATFPVAPPRLMDLGLTDTVTERSHAYRVLQPHFFTNQYAAMPSLHFGWDLLVGVAIVTTSRRWLVRVVGVLLPVLMAIAVVATANHYIIDAVAGAALGLFGGTAALWLEGHRRRAAARVGGREAG